MRTIITVLLISLCFACSAQGKYNWKDGLKKAVPAISISWAAGICGGLEQGLLFRRNEFFSVFPHANRQYWDTNVSWENKYWRGVPTQLTDAYHLTGATRNILLVGAGISMTIPIQRGWNQQPFGHTVLDALIQAAAVGLGYWAGSEVVFNGILHRR